MYLKWHTLILKVTSSFLPDLLHAHNAENDVVDPLAVDHKHKHAQHIIIHVHSSCSVPKVHIVELQTYAQVQIISFCPLINPVYNMISEVFNA